MGQWQGFSNVKEESGSALVEVSRWRAQTPALRAVLGAWFATLGRLPPPGLALASLDSQRFWGGAWAL